VPALRRAIGAFPLRPLILVVDDERALAEALTLFLGDEGYRVADVAKALEDGYSTGGGLGGGLPAVVRLMDEVAIATGPAGTRITATKWPTGRS
jgi:serine/threonine-protein kinase RsbT